MAPFEYNTVLTHTGYTFILKKVMLVRRSTVDFRSCRRSLLLAGKLFCSTIYTSQLEHNIKELRTASDQLWAPVWLTRYMDRSMRKELCSWSKSLTNLSFCWKRKHSSERNEEESKTFKKICFTGVITTFVFNLIPVHISTQLFTKTEWINQSISKCGAEDSGITEPAILNEIVKMSHTNCTRCFYKCVFISCNMLQSWERSRSFLKSILNQPRKEKSTSQAKQSSWTSLSVQLIR